MMKKRAKSMSGMIENEKKNRMRAHTHSLNVNVTRRKQTKKKNIEEKQR